MTSHRELIRATNAIHAASEDIVDRLNELPAFDRLIALMESIAAIQATSFMSDSDAMLQDMLRDELPDMITQARQLSQMLQAEFVGTA